MLIGAHVSPAGGPANAVARGTELGARSIQIFNQSPRMWKPTEYDDEKVAAFHEAMGASDVDALLIHAVYLLNAASEDPEIRAKTLTSLTSSLRAGDRLGAHCVVLHPGSALKGNVDEAIARAGEVIAEALAESDGCPLHLENTAGSGGTLGRSFAELAGLIDAAGGHERLGICLDSCHLYASGYDIRTAEGLTETLDEHDRLCGAERLGSLHLNDSKVGLGSNVDRHEKLGDGELGEDGLAVFLSEPRFDGLPVILETLTDPKTPSDADIRLCEELRERGRAARG